VAAAVPVDAAELVAVGICRVVVTIRAPVAASALVVLFVADVTVLAFPAIRAVALAVSSRVAGDVAGVVRAVRRHRALELAAVGVGVEDVDAHTAVGLRAAVVRPRAGAAVGTVPVVAAVADAPKLLVARDVLGVVVAVGLVVAGRRAARVVDAARRTLAAVPVPVVDVDADRAVGAVPRVGAVARAPATTIAGDVLGVPAAVVGVVAERRAVRVAAIADVASSAVVRVAVADRADAAVAAVPRVHALALAVRIEPADARGVRRAVRLVAALQAAVRIDALVATRNVAQGAVVRTREVGRAELAAITVPLVRTVALAVGFETTHVMRMFTTISQVADAPAIRIAIITVNAAITTERVRFRGIFCVVVERIAIFAEWWLPLFVTGTSALR
jgi:hypothetical protein